MEAMTDETTILADIEEKANALASSLVAATEAGVSQARILPLLMRVFKSTGLMP